MTMTTSQNKADKQKFFEQLNRLGQSDSDSDDDERTSLNPTPKKRQVESDDDEVQILHVQPVPKLGIQSGRNGTKEATALAAPAGRRNIPGVGRAPSFVRQRSVDRVQQSTNKVLKSSKTSRQTEADVNKSRDVDKARRQERSPLRFTNPVHPGVGPAHSHSTRKRRLANQPKPARRTAKVKAELELLPEADRIFNGLVLYFIPNNDVAPSRKRRIQASIARGAIWKHAYTDEVTHVVVDQDITFDNVSKGFPDNQIPQGATLLRDTWLTDSMRYKSVQNISSSRFQLKGAPKMDKEREDKPEQQLPKSAVQHERSRKRSIEEVTDPTRGRPLKRKPSELQDTPSTPEEEERASDELDAAVNEIRNTDPAAIESVAQAAPDSPKCPSLGSEVPETEPEYEEHSSIDTSKQEPTASKRKMQTFQCMHKHDGPISDESNPNARTMEMLQNMATYYDRTGDSWRTLAYRKAIGALRQQTTLIATRDQALAIPQIGERLADKIEEIVTTQRLRRYESTLDDPTDQALQLFTGIYDVGLKQATLWINQGHRTLDDLLTKKVPLTPNQRIGIAHHTDFNTRIPRDEIAQHAEIILRALRAEDFMFEIVVAGSYRRGHADSGDIDIIVTKANAGLSEIRSKVTTRVLPELQRTGFIKATLSTSRAPTFPSSSLSSSPATVNSAAEPSSGSKWLGASCLPGSTIWRRLDLLFVPWVERGAAMIYFTGNDIFNRSIRLLASKKGMRLNQHGLFKDVVRGKGGKGDTHGTLVESESEGRIFEALGVPWRPPEHRRC